MRKEADAYDIVLRWFMVVTITLAVACAIFLWPEPAIGIQTPAPEHTCMRERLEAMEWCPGVVFCYRETPQVADRGVCRCYCGM